MSDFATARRGFTAVPLVIVLAVTMVGLGLVIAFNTPPKTTASGAYNSGYQTGLIVGPILIAGFFVWVASRIAERRSEGLATAICGTILLVCNIAYGVDAVRALGIISSQRSKPGMVAKDSANQSQDAGNSQQLDTSKTKTPQSGSPSAQAPTTTPASTPTVQEPGPSETARPTVPQTRPAREGPVRGVPAPAKDEVAHEGSIKALAALREEVVGECLSLAKRAEAAYAKMRKPVTTLSALNKAMEEFGTIRADAEKLEKRLRGLGQEARERVKSAGSDAFETSRLVMEWERGVGAFERANGCGTLARTCETAQELFVILKDTLGKWKIDAAGKVTSPDRAVESRLFSPRAQMGFALDRQVETLNDLRQGDAAKGK